MRKTKQQDKQYDKYEEKPTYIRYDKPKPITENHKRYHNLLRDDSKKIIVCDGWAGTGKTITAMYHACKMVSDGKARGIVIARNGDSAIGFLPGTVTEKLTPKLRQMFLYAESFLHCDYNTLISNGTIIIQAIEDLQGMDYTEYVLIIDEGQTIDAKLMYSICTRGAVKVVINGDCSPAQCTNKKIKKGKDGLSFLMATMGHLPMIGVVNMNKEEDIVRSDYIKQVILCMTEALENWEVK